MKQKHDRRRVHRFRLFQQMDPAAFDVDEPPSRGNDRSAHTTNAAVYNAASDDHAGSKTKKSRQSGSCGGQAPAGIKGFTLRTPDRLSAPLGNCAANARGRRS